VIGGNGSIEDIQELMQGYPNNPLSEIVKCIIIIYASLIDTEAMSLKWDHNIDSDCMMSMPFIQRVRFIHNKFQEICNGDKSIKVDASFQK
jgi:hypothetical protein